MLLLDASALPHPRECRLLPGAACERIARRAIRLQDSLRIGPFLVLSAADDERHPLQAQTRVNECTGDGRRMEGARCERKEQPHLLLAPQAPQGRLKGRQRPLRAFSLHRWQRHSNPLPYSAAP